jgi:acetoacetyl-CoA reductase
VDVSFLPADLTQPGAAEALVQTVEYQHGGLDLLVNNADGDPLREFHARTIDDSLGTVQFNLGADRADPRGPPRDAGPRSRPHREHLLDGGPGLLPLHEAYAAAKDGLIGFTRVLRADYHARGISASTLILGAIRMPARASAGSTKPV